MGVWNKFDDNLYPLTIWVICQIISIFDHAEAGDTKIRKNGLSSSDLMDVFSFVRRATTIYYLSGNYNSLCRRQFTYDWWWNDMTDSDLVGVLLNNGSALLILFLIDRRAYLIHNKVLKGHSSIFYKFNLTNLQFVRTKY